MPSIGLCVLVHQRPAELLHALHSVQDQGFDEIVVLDNASEPPLDPVASTTWLRSDENLGVTGGRNLLGRTATSDVLVFIDDDAVALTDLTKVGELFSDPRLGAVAFRITRPDGEPVSHELPIRGSLEPTAAREVAYFVGAGYAVRREALEQVGGYDESFFYSTEEIDLAMSLIKAGYRVDYDPTLRVEHRPSERGRGVRPEVPALSFRNRVIYCRRHLRWPVAVLHITVWAGRSGLLAARSGHLAPFARRFGEGFTANVDRAPLPWRDHLRLHRLGGRILF